jgi:hypothetical protein
MDQVIDGFAKPAVVFGALGFAVAVGIAVAQCIVKCIELVRGAHRPSVPRSTAVGAPARRAVWDPTTVEYYGHEAVTQALRPIWLAKRPYDFNEAELAAWSELAGAFDDDYKQRGWR